MKRVLLGVLAAGTLAAPAPGALADHVEMTGGCFTDSVSRENVTDDARVGVIGGIAAVRSSSGVPVQARLSCKIKVDGTDATPTFTYSGTGVIAGADQLSYVGSNDAHITLCQKVDDEPWDCAPAPWLRIPVQEIIDFLYLYVIPTMPDPLTCPVLAALFPPQGDVVLPEPIGLLWDCPPYEL